MCGSPMLGSPCYGRWAMRKLAPTTYVIEEYVPPGMNGIMILEANLSIEVGYDDEPLITDINFPNRGLGNEKLPFVFIVALMRVLQGDEDLMDKVEEACCVEYERNASPFNG